MPLPWSSADPAYGFSPTGAAWLPQPAEWATLARDAQAADPSSTLALYRTLLAERRARALGAGTLTWLDGFGASTVAFRNGNVTVVANIGHEAGSRFPRGRVIVASGPVSGGVLPADTTVWIAGD